MWVALLGALLGGATAWAAPTGGFSLPEEDWTLEGEGLSTDALFARVDSLERVLGELQGQPRRNAQMRLAQLYLATDLMKHRRHALGLLEDILEEEPGAYEAAALWATMAQRMRYLSDARERLERSVDEFARDPRAPTHLGRFYFREARRRMLVPVFERAAAAFERALEIDAGYTPAWQGLATTRIALQQHAEALVAARRWMRLDPENEIPRWMEAASLVGVDSLDAARDGFLALLKEAPAPVVEVFEGRRVTLGKQTLEAMARAALPRRLVHRLMRESDPDWTVVDRVDWSRVLSDSTARRLAVDTYWISQDTRPTKEYNSSKLRFWRRLVEADVLFGDPALAARGWDTEMGDAWSRWGRPTSTFYDPGAASSLLSALDVAGVHLTLDDAVPQNTRIWVWTYRRPGVWFSLMFTDPTMNSRWRTSSATSAYIAERTRSEPLGFFEEETEPSTFELSLSTAVFPRSAEVAVLETYLRVDPGRPAGDSDSLAVVEWAIFDAMNRRIDFRRESLGADSRLVQLTDEHTEGSANSSLLWAIGARVRPGSYRVAVEVSDARGRGRTSQMFEVDVREPGPEGFLELSDVQVARRFEEFDPGAPVPPRFVKFGQVVIPSPSRRFGDDASQIGVYFEVRGPAVDEAGQTSLDVVYELFEDRRALRAAVSEREFRREKLERIDPLSSVFLNERTGVSREGVVIKGTNLPVAPLGRGSFLVLVTVTDRITGQSASRAAWFRRIRG